MSRADWGRRVAGGVVVTAATAPMVLLAHLLINGRAPAAGQIALINLAVLTVMVVFAPRRPAAIAAVVGLAQTLAHALLLVSSVGGHLTVGWSGAAGPAGCLPALGRGAELGVRLAFFRPGPDCPPGSIAAGPSTAVAVSTMLTAALILLGHGAVAALSGLGLAAGELAIELLISLGRLSAPIIAGPSVPVAAHGVLLAAPRSVRVCRVQWRPHPDVLRGPPPLRASSR